MKKLLSIFVIATTFMLSATGANAQSNNKGNGGRSQCFSSIGVFNTDFGQSPLPMGVYSPNDRYGAAVEILDDHTFKILFKWSVEMGCEVSQTGKYYEITPGLYHFECDGWSEDFLLDGEDIVTPQCERWYHE